MKAVILAAGMGMRLEDTVPKPMISLEGGETILDFQIKKLTKYISVHDIFVVVGYKKELLMEKHPELAYVYNHQYTKTNTAKSLLLALQKIKEDTIWLNGDVFFDEEVLAKLTDAKNTTILVQNKKCGEEEIKYNVDGKGFVKEISKSVTGGLGEAVGINLIKEKDLPAFVEHLKAVGPQDYFEKAVENMIKKDKI
ncbi:MAG: phosphocholine cytidylyltransferase family protein, partial [Candidatus Omnitrophota bacterium]